MKKIRKTSEEILRRISRLSSESPRSEKELRNDLHAQGIDPEQLLAKVLPHVHSLPKSADASHILVGRAKIIVNTDISLGSKEPASAPIKGQKPFDHGTPSRTSAKRRLKHLDENRTRS